jgi:hypothetical protein
MLEAFFMPGNNQSVIDGQVIQVCKWGSVGGIIAASLQALILAI